MIASSPGYLRGILSLCIYASNTLFWCTFLLILAGLKALVPFGGWRRQCNRVLHLIAENWIGINNLNQTIIGKTRWKIRGLGPMERKGSYLILANHQSWVDILVLQRIFNRKIPLFKFFIKKELFWFPLLGQAWWALDFPFIKRYSKSHLDKNPRLRGKDLETTRKACEKFRQAPTSIMNFVEGTRFTKEKHNRQQSPYAHLLKPKAGGIAAVLDAMGDRIHRVLDVTIVYPEGVRSFWAFVSGNIREIRVYVRSLSVGPELKGDYANDARFRERLQEWINEIWREKDRHIECLIQQALPCPELAALEGSPVRGISQSDFFRANELERSKRGN